MFDSLDNRELAIAVIQELRKRSLYGCLFLLPETGGPSVFASSTPAGTIRDQTASQQLAVFAHVASMAENERAYKLSSDGVETPEPTKKDWIN